jgi:hypothetical protein
VHRRAIFLASTSALMIGLRLVTFPDSMASYMPDKASESYYDRFIEVQNMGRQIPGRIVRHQKVTVIA